METSLRELLMRYVSQARDSKSHESPPKDDTLVPYSQVISFIKMCEQALGARDKQMEVLRLQLMDKQQTTLEESSFMADQVESLYQEKHELQVQVLALQRDLEYMREQNTYLQQQLQDQKHIFTSAISEPLLGEATTTTFESTPTPTDTDVQAGVINAQLQNEVEQLRQQIAQGLIISQLSSPMLLAIPISTACAAADTRRTVSLEEVATPRHTVESPTPMDSLTYTESVENE